MSRMVDRPANAMDCTFVCVACAVTASQTTGTVSTLATVGLVLFALIGIVLLWREHTDLVEAIERDEARHEQDFD